LLFAPMDYSTQVSCGVKHPEPVRRAVHPKARGCVRATFTVDDDIAAEYQVGLFAQPGRQFAAIILFSNAAAVDLRSTSDIR
jgi:catalase